MTQQVNLYNVALTPRVERLSGRLALRAMAGVAACTCLAVLAVQWETARVVRLAAQQDARRSAVQTEVIRMARDAAARKPDADVAGEIESLQRQLEGRQHAMARLQRGDLGDTGGVSEYLRAFARQRLDGVWLTGLTIDGAGREISVRGRTLDAQLLPDYLARLREESALRGRAFATLAVDTPTRNAGDEASASPAYLEFRLATTEGDSPAASGAQGGAR